MMELTFYGLQAHFLSVNAEVIHGRVAAFTKKIRGANSEDGKGVSDETQTHGNSVRRASVMPSPARRMGVNPTLCLTTEPVKGLIGDCCGLSEDGPNPRARLMILALTPWTFISSSPRLAS